MTMERRCTPLVLVLAVCAVVTLLFAGQTSAATTRIRNSREVYEVESESYSHRRHDGIYETLDILGSPHRNRDRALGLKSEDTSTKSDKSTKKSGPRREDKSTKKESKKESDGKKPPYRQMPDDMSLSFSMEFRNFCMSMDFCMSM